ncbi:hypothetical protein [Dethiobacter alkaliphilus]|uniref:hypothetical protein n=1 Tax=Dethiobacter alkaliphilus TaxID=427926 RepID=UPI002227F554|nr:hypothetical protein [Dethiobacter alkaliphilus]MCW3489857.1 hypothetical protein [Dethiobacter alkaliphilus]
MTLLKLGLACILLALGMMLLPPLSAEGVAGVATRSWLALGLLVFCGNYLYYLEEGERAAKKQEIAEFRARYRAVPFAQRSRARR